MEQKMHRIAVGKNDEVPAIVEKVMDAEGAEVIISIPKFSRIAESAANFHLLKREADVLKKQIRIESVDDRILEHCARSGIEASNPFFNRSVRRVSDIVLHTKERRGHVTAPQTEEVEEQTLADPDSAVPEVRLAREGGVRKVARRMSVLSRLRGGTPNMVPRLPGRRAFFFAGLVLIGGGVLWAVFALPRAEIVLTPIKVDWHFGDKVVAAVSESAPDAAMLRIPSQVFTERKNVQLFFPATGRKQTERKARGVITIVNAFSSTPQPLVATTRFETPDGKVFRLARSVTVPGARVNGGTIESASIEAEAVADVSGAAYNIGPVERFTIPGFAGTPKFAGFYATSKVAMAGGAQGEMAVPTAEDTRKAKVELEQTLHDALKAALTTKAPDTLKILEGTERFRLVSQDIAAEAGNDGQFSAFGEAELSAIAFSEENLLSLLAEKAVADIGNDVVLREHTISYADPVADFKKETLTMLVEYQGTFARVIDKDEVGRRVAGLTEDELRAQLLTLPGLERAHVSLWPFWVRRVPSALERVTVVVE